MKTTSQHIPFEQLTYLAHQRAEAGELGESERIEAMSHISTCTSCGSKLQKLEDVILLMKTDREPDAPRDLIAYAINIFDQGRESIVTSALRRLVAALTFDSNVGLAPAFGVRSGQLPSSRQLLYSAEGSDVELRITPREDQWVVAGQVLGRECVGGEVNLVNLVRVEGEERVAVAVLNELCEFSLPAVPPGSYKLLLRLTDLEVEVPQLELRA